MRATIPCLAGWLVAATVAAAPSDAAAQDAVLRQLHDSGISVEARVPKDSAARVLTTRSGIVDMLLIDGVVVLQLTDDGVEMVRASGERSRLNTGLVQLFEGMFLLLGFMADAAIRYDLRHLHDVRFESGEIVFEDRAGQRVFSNLYIRSENVLASFGEAEARAFVEHLRSAPGR